MKNHQFISWCWSANYEVNNWAPLSKISIAAVIIETYIYICLPRNSFSQSGIWSRDIYYQIKAFVVVKQHQRRWSRNRTVENWAQKLKKLKYMVRDTIFISLSKTRNPHTKGLWGINCISPFIFEDNGPLEILFKRNTNLYYYLFASFFLLLYVIWT